MHITHLDFMPAKAPFRMWRLALCMIGVTVLGIAAGNWALQYKVMDATSTQLSLIRPASTNQPQRSKAEQRALEAQASVIAGAVQQLNLPIHELIAVLRPPKDIHVALLGLDLGSNTSKSEDKGVESTTSGLLKITAESKSPQEMMSYVAFLGEQKIFKSVYLTKHELNNNVSPASYRFQLEARWQK